MHSKSFHNMNPLLLFPVVLLSVAAVPYDNYVIEEWNLYKETHHKVYETPHEDARRLRTYIDNKRRVENHNRKYERGETSYSMALNHFSDWFPEEIHRMNGLKSGLFETSGTDRRIFELEPGTEVPESINWVKKGAVTRVKNQGHCGSCYAFSAVGALEGLMYRKNKTIMDLSVQELVDCSGNNGCNGGSMLSCFVYVMNNGGIDSEKSYPYKAESGYCQAKEGVQVASCTDFFFTPEGDETALKAAVGTVGPVAIGFGVTRDFMHYKSGIYDGSCTNMNHGMLAVGYDTDEDSGMEYWLVKNSWGTYWGMDGYVRIPRNQNKCHIADDCSFPGYH